MTKRIMDPDVQQFFDLEADVTDNDDSEGADDEAENEMMLQFLVDDESVGEQDENAPIAEHNNDENDDSNTNWEEFMERAQERGRVNLASNTHYIEDLLPFVTKPDDYPLWRIACRVGMELGAIQSLFNSARDHHEVRSAVLRDSIPGYIYVEASMNRHLISLLLITPGIIKLKSRPKMKGIPCSEFTDIFRMNDDSTRFRKGSWVIINEGLYQGDVGLVIGGKDWCIEVLVVPRLTKTKANPQKRKRSTVKPAPSLFDPSDFPPAKVVQIDADTYMLGSLRIEHGLCRRGYDFGTLASAETITYPLFKKFRLSKHPAVLDIDIPRPQEWIFEENDRVQILSSGRMGQVIAIHSLYLEVNRDLDMIIQNFDFIHDDHERVRWYNIRKVFNIGDYVKVTGGPHFGECGWVVKLEENDAVLNLAAGKISCVNLVVQKRLTQGETAPYRIEAITIPINCLRAELTPYNVGGVGPSGNPFVGREMKNPWIGRDVVVTQDKHPSRGCIGTVKDVVPSHAEGQTVHLLVEFGHKIRPGLPFEKILIPLEYVQDRSAFLNDDTAADLSKSVTEGSSSHAVRENSRPQRENPAHILLHSFFEGLEVRAKVKGGVFEAEKEKLVQILKIDDRLILRTKNQRTIVTLEPEWVTVVHPNGRGDNNLLVCIAGEHIGKFCRRIYHRDDCSGPVSIFAAIVERHPNTSDSLSGEEMEAPMSHFAIVSETQVEKQQKGKLMESLRNKWRGK